MKGHGLTRVLTVALLLAVAATSMAETWTTYTLPDNAGLFNTWALGHTTSGQFIYGDHGNLYVQDAFGGSSYTEYDNSPVAGTDPAFITTYDADTAVLGKGGWGASALVSFDPSDTGTAFSSGSFTLQGYRGVFHDETSMYIAGANGNEYTNGFGGFSNNLMYVALDGSTSKVIINDYSQYSCGFTKDSLGNLYVGDNDDGRVYKFTAAQISGAISGDALEITDGELICDFGLGGDIGSLAVDADGVLWGAGWGHTGLKCYDQDSESFYTWTPGYDTTAYLADTFSYGGSNYVGFASADGSDPGVDVMYGFAEVGAVPEPATMLLLLPGMGGILALRRRRFARARRVMAGHSATSGLVPATAGITERPRVEATAWMERMDRFVRKMHTVDPLGMDRFVRKMHTVDPLGTVLLAFDNILRR
ncbi:PEP-CTERM sorting domain-containing protein [Kiritimatiella glycovorans]|uniref:PEP-CTERM protein-sorting domain-containing protein n=1 Tax=Kiritimatiella glycovorans TaxID=1307763 RepID=A0A0G3EJI6_9BACT|nr:PEP-CTERM sorting domain-containing protein [Kiritimatiella glycovorans]AKJ65612.1 hypothetical protein L21SP4_02387 [Kiritimatiella glycovorans]